MQFVQVETSDNDRRWINLHQLSRVTIGEDESSQQLLVAVFADGDIGNSLRIVGHTDLNREAIRQFERALNDHSIPSTVGA